MTRFHGLAVRLLLVAWTIFLFSGAAAPGPARRGARTESQLYVPQDSWTDTMLATRARYQQHRAEQLQHSGNAQAKPFVSDALLGEGPGQKIAVDVSGCRWMRLVSMVEQGGGNCHIWGDAKLIAKDGRVTYLGSLKPVMIRVGWGELLVDKNWQNHPLQIGAQKFEHGIWVHAESNVCYALEGKYERFEAWVGMDVDRATGVSRFKVLFEDPDLAPEVWRQIAADFPVQAKWFQEDAGRQCAEWLNDAAGSQYDQAAIQRALGQLGGHGAELRRQFDELRKTKAPGHDRRWLDLYVRACRYRECAALLDRVWVSDLQQALTAQFVDLLGPQSSPDDPRWETLKTKVGKISEALPTAQRLDMAGLRAALGPLAKALPGRFCGAETLTQRVEEHQQRWQAVTPAAARGDEQAILQLPSLAAQARELRRAVLCGFRGMSEFLAAPGQTNMDREWEIQFAALQYDIGNRGHFARVAPEVFRREASIHESDRDPCDVVLRRTAALLADLKRTDAAARLAAAEQELAALQAANSAIEVTCGEARFALFAEACRLRRQIAFQNSLLSFRELLFIKRHRSLYSHMCDQYYGMAATPGGGLFVLSDPCGPNPQTRDVLAQAVVENGRLQGQKLSGGPSTPPPLSYDGGGNVHGPESAGGSFLSPDLSPDGKSALFAYVECRGDQRHRHHTDPTQGHWAEGRCFHIFKVNVDGTHLQQLSDGTWNDFDPCWLPNGRIAFISERRGGYLRCGRVCPTYTLYDMAADGSDITCLSFHETNEWNPSVTHDGRIIYTRWDYVDRHGCTAHLPWITTLDGRDSRAVHGNFAPRPSRPDMELDCRAIPNSHKFVATAAPHHGQAYGSLVLIDSQVVDDDAMAPVKRITPEVGFPESQGGPQVYGTAWPLSEDYYLCVYDATMKAGSGFQGGEYLPGNYGIYLVDSFGNKELLYRDPQIACLSPIPLRPMPRPHLVPELAKRGPDTNPATRPAVAPDGRSPTATVSVLNVYDSLKPWPEGTKIKELRVLQVLPMSVPSGGPPHETALRVATAGDSVVPTRWVLGTVPVEADGSAHFVAPANKEVFFQALDERGLAVQSMRSATYLHEDEHLVCAGCHEPKHRSPQTLKTVPLALRRQPSTLKPDVDGSNPFSYPRLVQPVLDRHCVKCHAEHPSKPLNLAREPLAGRWYASYSSLVQRYGFHDYGDAMRTTPGRFGAKASKLYDLLQKGHYEVKLSDEEWHRIALWLDCSSLFYGVYEREGGEAQLRGELVKATLE
jgi:hypothetical protein